MNFDDLEYVLSIPPLITDDLAASLAIDLPPEILPNDALRHQVLSHLKTEVLPTTVPPDPAHGNDPYLPLGRRFERLAGEVLAKGFPGHSLRKNIQLPEKPTPGELDFLVMSERELLHVEVAVKFFLYLPPARPQSANLACFYGPRKKDRLDLKLHKLFHQQLRHDIPETLRLYLGQRPPVRRALWLSGRLFYPWDCYQKQSHLELKLGLNPDHHTGWYLPCDRLAGEMPQDGFVILEKPQWIQPWSSISQSKAAQSIRRAEDFKRIEEPQALLRLSSSGNELDRGFVVPATWAQSKA